MKRYASGRRFVAYHHEQAYLLAKGQPIAPARQIPDILPWRYTGNRWHPTEKPLSALSPLVEAKTSAARSRADARDVAPAGHAVGISR